jgi:3-deoxy-D-manno-octulosonic-acid transferase
MFNFVEISELYLQQKAAVQVASADELARQVAAWLSDASERSRIGEAGRALVEKNRGALDRLTHLAEKLLDAESD